MSIDFDLPVGLAAQRRIEELVSAKEKLEGSAPRDVLNARELLAVETAINNELARIEENILQDYSRRNMGKPWEGELLARFTKELESLPDARSWELMEGNLRTLIQRFGRTKKLLIAKALELGYGRKVDYWIFGRREA